MALIAQGRNHMHVDPKPFEGLLGFGQWHRGLLSLGLRAGVQQIVKYMLFPCGLTACTCQCTWRASLPELVCCYHPSLADVVQVDVHLHMPSAHKHKGQFSISVHTYRANALQDELPNLRAQSLRMPMLVDLEMSRVLGGDGVWVRAG
jgi:hypothetical protein